MADITDQEAINFSNNYVRPGANFQIRTYYHYKKTIDEHTATNMIAKIPNNADVLKDNSEIEGRFVINGTKINGLLGYMQGVIDDLEANNNLKLNILLQIGTTSD